MTTSSPNIVVVGAGYVGLATAVFLADGGFPVTVVERDCGLVENLRRKRLHFKEPTLARTLRRVVGSGHLRPVTPTAEPYQQADLVFIAIDSADRKTWQMRLHPFEEMARWIGGVRRKRPATVVLKSTNVIGFSQRLRDLLDATPHGSEVRLVVNPEFLREGMAFEDTAKPFRIVVGAREKKDASPLLSLYRKLYPEDIPIINTDWKSAELIKLASNVYLAYRLSFVNEMADFARTEGLDFEAIRMGIGLDQRIGLEYFRQGMGFGGSCLPKDCMLINSEEAERDFTFESALTSIAVNDRLLENLLMRLKAEIGSLKGKRIALLGAAFKPEVDDTRDSRAVRLAELLRRQKADVRVYDPYLSDKEVIPETEIPLCGDLETALKGAHAVIIGTAHRQFGRLNPKKTAGLVVHRLIFDYFGLLAKDAWTRAGFRIVS